MFLDPEKSGESSIYHPTYFRQQISYQINPAVFIMLFLMKKMCKKDKI